MPTAFVTGADRGLGLGITAALLSRGWQVGAGQYLPQWEELPALQSRYPGSLVLIPLDVGSISSCRAAAGTARRLGGIDMLVTNAGVLGPSFERTIGEGLNYDEMLRDVDINSFGPLRAVEAFLGLMSNSDLKRLSFVSSEAGSIGASGRTGWFGYCMSKAALNMGVKNLYNDLRPKGFTFRVYHPGWIKSYMHGEKNEAATFTPDEGGRMAVDYFCGTVNEDRLVLRTHDGAEMPW